MQSFTKLCFFGSIPAIQFKSSDMTAIAAVTAEWGVLMAADGRLSAVEGLSGPISEHAQKLFPVAIADRRIMYALAGCVGSGHSIGELKVDIRTEFITHTDSKNPRDYTSPIEYVSAVAEPVTEYIKTTRYFPKSNSKSADGKHWKIVEAIFAGCFSDIPFVLVAEFSHDDKKPSMRITQYAEGLGNVLCYGSEAVYKEMYDSKAAPRKSMLSRYELNLGKQPTVTEARCFAVGYIEACCSPEGRSLDPNGCKTIGGHIHAATIKPRSGFQWVVAPVMESSTLTKDS
jgi:hypothetical protein